MQTLNAAIRHIEIPERMRRLPISEKGFPIPWFVSWLDDRGNPVLPGNGTPDFRVIHPEKISLAHRKRICWLCGDYMGQHNAFVIGPMCAINRTSGEPPCHYDCAHYAVRACPFLTKPNMRRNTADMVEGHYKGDGFLERNPGVAMIWVTRSYKIFNKDRLFEIGEPTSVSFYREGRTATRAEIIASIESGLPLLRAMAEKEGPTSVELLTQLTARAMQYLPAA